MDRMKIQVIKLTIEPAAAIVYPIVVRNSGAKLGKIISELSSSQKLRTEIIYGINHDFSLVQGQEDLIRIVLNWASQMA